MKSEILVKIANKLGELGEQLKGGPGSGPRPGGGSSERERVVVVVGQL